MPCLKVNCKHGAIAASIAEHQNKTKSHTNGQAENETKTKISTIARQYLCAHSNICMYSLMRRKQLVVTSVHESLQLPNVCPSLRAQGQSNGPAMTCRGITGKLA